MWAEDADCDSGRLALAAVENEIDGSPILYGSGMEIRIEKIDRAIAHFNLSQTFKTGGAHGGMHMILAPRSHTHAHSDERMRLDGNLLAKALDMNQVAGLIDAKLSSDDTLAFRPVRMASQQVVRMSVRRDGGHHLQAARCRIIDNLFQLLNIGARPPWFA